MSFTFEGPSELLHVTIPILLRLGVAFFCGALVGLEREVRGKTAGLRTNILICLGAAIYMTVSELVAKHVAHTPGESARIAAGVVTGIGFLGAGAIVRGGGAVQGLTTAASIWLVAGIGMAIGAGFPILGFAATALTLATLILLGRLEERISGPCKLRSVRVVLEGTDTTALLHLETALAAGGRHVSTGALEAKEGMTAATFAYCTAHAEHHAFLARVLAIPGIRVFYSPPNPDAGKVSK